MEPNREMSFGTFLPHSELGIEVYHCSTISIITLKHMVYLTNTDMNHYNNSMIFEMESQNNWTQFEKF